MQQCLALSELCVRLIPAGALLVALCMHNEHSKLKTILLSQLAAVACAAFGLVIFLLTQPLNSTHAPTPLFGLFRLDFLGSVMATSITFITMIVVWFSERNLLGDKTRLVFIQHIVAVSTAASILVAANDLILFLMCWHALSILLWRIVALKTDSARSARSVLYHHLFSDVCFLLAVVVIFNVFQTSDMGTVFNHLGLLAEPLACFRYTLPVASSTVVSLLLVLAMVSKSALFPFHRWLLATIDAPTPLSGLLHAGVVNVSAIMAARMYSLLTVSTTVHVLWLAWAASAALIGTLCMSTRSDTKGELVFSTVGQMGFMSLQCAVGAIPAAIFHLIAHGFFKCLLFLQAHSSISDGLVKMRFGHAHGGIDPNRSKMHMGFLCLLAVPVLIWLCMQESVDSAASLSVLIAMGALISSVAAFKRIGLGLLLGAGAVFLAAVVLAGELSKFSAFYMAPSSVQGGWILVACIIAFAVITIWLNSVRGFTLGNALYVHALNGFYVDELSDGFKGGVTRITDIFRPKRSSYERRRKGAQSGR